MKNNLNIVRATLLILVSSLLLTVFASCGPPRVMQQEQGQDFNYEFEDETTVLITKVPSKSDVKNYQKLVTFITENGQSYLYKYANSNGVYAQTYSVSEIEYEKVVWKEYTEKVAGFSYIKYKIGLSYSKESGVHILCECSYTNTGYSYCVRIMQEPTDQGTAEIVETKAGNDRSALINFDAANYNGEIIINQMLTFGNPGTSDNFNITAEYIVNGVLTHANEFIEAEITGASLGIIGIG